MDLMSYAADVVETLGGIIEPLPDDQAAMLLPAQVAAALHLPEEAHLVSDLDPAEATGPKTLLLSYGSDALDKLARAAMGQQGRVATLLAHAAAPRNRTAEEAVTKALQPVNGVVRVIDSAQAYATYLLASFHYAAAGDERREGLVDVAVTLDGLAAAPSLPEALWGAQTELTEAPPADDAAPEPRALKRAAAMARLATEQALAPVSRVLANRLARGVTRMHGYYRAMQEETLRAGCRRARDPEAEQKLVARVNAIPDELQRRIAEQRARLALRVTVRPLTAMLVTMPVVEVRLRLLRRKTEREITLAYGSLQRAVDLPLCEGCGARPVAKPTLCDEHAHVLCEACLWTCPACEARTCLACARRCRRCRAPAPRATPITAQVPSRGSEGASGPGHAEAAAAPTPSPGGSASAEGSPARATDASPATGTPDPKAVPKAVSKPVRARDRQAASQPRTRQPGNAKASGPVGRTAPPPTSASSLGRQGRAALAELGTQLRQHLGTEDPAQRIRSALRDGAEISAAHLAELTGLPIDATRQALKELRAKGEVTLVGAGRGARYRLG